LHCFDKNVDADDVQDVDNLGNFIWQDPERPTRNYYGFTRDGINKMKEAEEFFSENAMGYDDLPRPAPAPDPTPQQAQGGYQGGRGGGYGHGNRGRGRGRY
jgi:hypothetical protein